MKTEMDLVGMDERDRWCWLMANRATLMAVGLCWIGLIAKSLNDDTTPWFMIIMVPVFALVRFLFYVHYKRPSAVSGPMS